MNIIGPRVSVDLNGTIDVSVQHVLSEVQKPASEAVPVIPYDVFANCDLQQVGKKGAAPAPGTGEEYQHTGTTRSSLDEPWVIRISGYMDLVI